MATITTSTFLDTATGTRTAGETWNINGATLTVRTDTRVYAGAPASMTGSLGGITLSATLGGAFNIDATTVRWMPYGSGSGNVPAINTVITQGAVSGVLLGVWASYTSAPTAPGAAMPASGFMKFREVTGGAFSVGALSGIGASASSPDVVGWIEVALDPISINTGSIGSVTATGDWFQLGETSGSRGQILGVPSNGGGAGTHVWAVQVETAPGSNQYEWYSGTVAAQGWNTTEMATDARAKFFESMGNGQIRFGADGSANSIGDLPVAGCKVRVPNIMQRSVAVASRSANFALPSSVTGRASISSGSTGYITLKNISGDLVCSLANLKSVSVIDSALEWNTVITNTPSPISITNSCFGSGITGQISANTFDISSNVSLVTMTDCRICSMPSSSGMIRINSSENVILKNVKISLPKARTNATSMALNITNSGNVIVEDVSVIGASTAITGSSDVTVKNFDFIDRLSGPTTATIPLNAIRIDSSSSNVMVDGFSFGNKGALANTNCYNAIFYTNATGSKIRIRNVGTRTNFVDCGTGATASAFVVENSASGGNNIELKRIYVTPARTNLYTMTFPAQRNGWLLESVWGGTNTTVAMSNVVYKGCGGTTATTTTASNAGLHFSDFFDSDTTGILHWAGNTPSPATQSFNTPSGTAVYLDSGSTVGVLLPATNDEFVSEMQWFVKGHTGFQNATPAKTGGSNVTNGVSMEYQIDTGSGWNGIWKAMTGANLSAEVLDPAVGFKMKIKGTSTSNSVQNILSSLKIATTSSLSAQANNLYPLDTVTLSFEGLQLGSEVRVYLGDDPATAVEIAGIESVATDTWSFQHNVSGQVGYIMIFAMGYQPIMIPRTFAFENSSLLIQQTIDRNYNNPA